MLMKLSPRALLAFATYALLVSPIAAQDRGQAASAASEAAESARDAAMAAAEAARSAAGPAQDIEMPQPSNRKLRPIRSISVTAPKSELLVIMQRHRQRCQALGSSLCRLESFNVPNHDVHRGGELQLALSANSAEVLAPGLAADVGQNEFRIARGEPNDESGSFPIRRRILLLMAEALRKAPIATNAAERRIMLQEQQNIESELQNIERQTSGQGNETEQRLQISYRSPDQQNYGQNRWYDEYFKIALTVTLSAIGLALVSVLYFGIIGFGVLWLRRLAIRKGLLKGGIALPLHPVPPPNP